VWGGGDIERQSPGLPSRGSSWRAESVLHPIERQGNVTRIDAEGIGGKIKARALFLNWRSS